MYQVNPSYRSLRVTIGVLGMALPVLLIIGNGLYVEKSISYFYYTRMSTVFTGVLITFGLILFTYKGPTLPGEIISENALTHLGGIFALLVALIPTKFGSDTADLLFYAHNDYRGMIHNASAVLFIFIMGLVVLYKFSQAPFYRMFYKIFGILVMAGLVLAIVAFFSDSFNNFFQGKGVFIGETFALWAFGIAWLRRGVPKKNKTAVSGTTG